MRRKYYVEQVSISISNVFVIFSFLLLHWVNARFRNIISAFKTIVVLLLIVPKNRFRYRHIYVIILTWGPFCGRYRHIYVITLTWGRLCGKHLARFSFSKIIPFRETCESWLWKHNGNFLNLFLQKGLQFI